MSTASAKRYSPEIEKEILEFWEKNNIRKKVFDKRKDGKKFYFLDGPPYTSGYIHLGTAWNKVLKDIVIKYLLFKGYAVRAQPGWDMHGLPIEVLTEKKLGFKTKKDIEKFGVDKFIEECKKLALNNLEVMEKQFRRLGVFMDWENPYRTIDPKYIESEWYTFKKAWEKNLLYVDERVIHWCPRCQTALAEHEIEYKELEDPSIYVKFKLKGKDNEYVLIWTTTPWTLPANMAVLAHPDYTYVKVRVDQGGNKEYYWLLEDRLEAVMAEIGIKKYEVVDRKKGAELDGWKYEYPLLEEMPRQKEFESNNGRVHTIVLGTFVETTEGTGLVHIAPGHGQEDWQIGKQYGLPVYSPIDEEGKYVEGAWKGIFVKDADKLIIETLKSKGLLLYFGKIKHRYPTCWRCKSPLLFRATKQWFLAVSKIKEGILREDEKHVEWVPEWVRKRYQDGVANVGDWVISRQRYWNAPIPIWKCEKCGHIEVIGSFDELRKLSKNKLPEKIDPHRPYIDNIVLRCPKCGGDMHRIPDVLDVWFDSAIAGWASLGYPKKRELFDRYFPADLIIEGQDQVMKWFYAQQVLSYVVFGYPPYKKVVMHGFVLDAAGSKMSKSLGNIIMPEQVIEKYGADTLRVYLSTIVSPWEDIRFKWSEVEEVYSALNILWNVHIMAKTYMDLDKFDPTKYDEKFFEKYALPEDRWVISRVNSFIRSFEDDLNNLHFARAGRRLLEFIVEDLSRWYGKLIRWRLWIEKDDPVKTVAYYTLYKVFLKLLPPLAVYASYIAEYIYQNLIKDLNKSLPESVFLLDWPAIDLIDEKLERYMEIARDIVSAVGAARTQAKIKARWPLKRLIIDTKDDDVISAVQSLKDIIVRTANIKEIVFDRVPRHYLVKPKMKRLGPKFRKMAKQIAVALEKKPAEEIKQSLEESGKYIIKIGNVEYVIEPEDIEISLASPEGLSIAEFSRGLIAIETKLDEELLSEGLARDLIRRIQQMRKELDLNIEEYIEVYIEGPDEFKNMISRHLDYIKGETRAKRIIFAEPSGYVKEWKIEEYTIKIGIKRLSD